MTHDPVEVVRSMIRAWNEQDPEAIRALAHEDVRWINPPNALEPGTRVGQEALVAVAQAQWEIVDDIELQRVESSDQGVLTVNNVTGTIPGSDARVGTRAVMRWIVRDGAVVSIEVLGAGSDFDRAFEAAGLKGSPEPTEERSDGQDTA
jgi:ketosteroid isomerase-like protein